MGKSKELAELGNMTWNEAALSSYDRRIELDGSIRLGTSTSANRSIDFSDSPDSDEKWQIYGWGDQFQISKRTSSWGWASTPLAIDSAGRVTMPSQPVISLGLSQSDTNWTTNNTNVFTAGYAIIYDVNIGNMFNTSNGRFTVPVAGSYEVNFYTIKRNSGESYYQIRINGSDWLRPYSNNNATNWSTLSATGIKQLSAGDYITLEAMSGSATAEMHGREHMRFTVKLIG